MTMIQKPGKVAEKVESYRPINLLPVLSKLFEKLLLLRLSPIIEKHKLISNHQFGFRRKHATIEQIHRIVKRINNDMEAGRYCMVVFLDVSQAFDKMWYDGLLHKAKNSLSFDFYVVIKSYLIYRTFLVKYGNAVTQLKDIYSGVPQGSILGPMLYLQTFQSFWEL